MIIFDLACPHGHRFEGWFESLAGFEKQLAQDMVTCPQCGSLDIRRIPSLLHVGKSERAAKPIDEAQAKNAITPAIDEHAALETALQAMQELIPRMLSQCEDLGKDFAEEARKIHYAEAPERAIRGNITRQEFEDLREEGIDVLVLPKIKNNSVM